MQPMLNIAVRAARRAGDIIIRSLNRVHQLDVRSKGRNDFVTEVDTVVEQDIIATIRKTYPDHGFLAEESGKHSDRSGTDADFALAYVKEHATTPELRGKVC